MPTYYIDFEGGNDANTGLSFAQRWQTITNGATAARIAPGDEIRIMASPDPTSIGNATWTGGGTLSNLGVVTSNNTASTSACVTGSTAVVGDYCRIAKSISYDTKADSPQTVKEVEAHNSKWVCVCEGDCPAKGGEV